MPSRRSTKIRLYADEMGKKLVADGSDFIVVVAEVTDDNGNIRRLAKEQVQFTVEGEGTIIDDGNIMANPRATEWGSAPILVRSTHQAGTIRIIARSVYEGTYTPAADTLTIESIPYTQPQCYQEVAHRSSHSTLQRSQTGKTLSDAERKKTLDEVERQQQDFGIQ